MKYLILFFLVALSTPAAANGPQCTKKSIGEVSCMASKLCECVYERASAMRGTPDMFKWDCGITRPNCMDYNKIEDVKPYDGPSSVEIDGGNTIKTTIKP